MANMCMVSTSRSMSFTVTGPGVGANRRNAEILPVKGPCVVLQVSKRPTIFTCSSRHACSVVAAANGKLPAPQAMPDQHSRLLQGTAAFNLHINCYQRLTALDLIGFSSALQQHTAPTSFPSANGQICLWKRSSTTTP
eukprot:GHUV01054052.1.p1 GENE.GHUV01054052.1~~GHUV01054052.1.p1  ORF type:complete len:138 (+),score=33.88 GHUV01054052.1:323-736(+)